MSTVSRLHTRLELSDRPADLGGALKKTEDVAR